MAHPWRRSRHPLTAFFAANLAIVSLQAGAISLGEAEVRSALGESLDVRIPVTIGKDESIQPSCFSLSGAQASHIPRLAAATISIERSVRGAQLRIRSGTPIVEPALMLGIAASCPGQASEYQRDYSLLLDPKPAPRVALTPMSIAATLIARIGDTLESIADAIFPRNRSARNSYIAALRTSNPPLAALGEREPIAAETRIALPDLHSFAKLRSESRTPIARVQPPAGPEARVRAQPRPAALPREREPARPRLALAAPRAEQPAATKAPAPATRGRPSPGYQLKLSSAEVDLSRSRNIDDRRRAQLRDRQLVLDADDQVAAVLALRNSVRQLESKVAELQLKLAGMPSSFPAPKGEAAQPAGSAASKVEPAPSSAGVPASKVPTPPAIAPPPPAAALTPPPTVKAPPPAVTPSPPAVSAPTPAVKPPATAGETSPPAGLKTESAPTPPAPPLAAKPAPPVDTKPVMPFPTAKPTPAAAPRPGAADNEWLTYGLWALAVLLLAVAALLAWRLLRRRRSEYKEEETRDEEETPNEEETRDEEETPDEGEIVVAEEPERQEPVFAEAPIAPPRDMRPTVASDAELTTRIPGNTDDLRRRYIEERFPEIANGAIALDDPNSVVKAARLFYEDGAIARAVELLHFAIERKPTEVKTWLALFEIFRLERLSGEFADLAQRFKEYHGSGNFWRKVQFFGREIDPGNKLYQDESFKSFETIGPARARHLAEEASFDPIAENWLNAPMDFQNEVLANELRRALMAQASLNEQDLVANPMPALRNVEMFTVA